MRQHSELQSTDHLIFADEIIFRPCDEGWLVISVLTANWMVIRSDLQKHLLQQLISGLCIGEVYTSLHNPDEQSQFKQLLAAITARNFAGVNTPPVPLYLEGYRMLNIYLTNACNLHCEHCFMRSGKPLENELTKAEWLRILTEFNSKEERR